MAYRCSASDVQAVIETDEDIDLEPFIKTANARINALLLSCSAMASSLSSELAIVETWLAAHYCAKINPALTQEGAGKASGSYETGVVGKYLESTRFGQTAIEVDSSGCLAKLQSSLMKGAQSASLHYLGKKASDKLDWSERE